MPAPDDVIKAAFKAAEKNAHMDGRLDTEAAIDTTWDIAVSRANDRTMAVTRECPHNLGTDRMTGILGCRIGTLCTCHQFVTTIRALGIK